MASKLIVIQQDSSRKYEVELSKEETRIGRSPLHSDLVLDGDRVSRRHALVRRVGQSFYVVDLESANGTFVNGQRVKQQQLRNKDTVTIGNFSLVYAETDTLPAIEYANKPAGSTIVLRDPRQIGLSGSVPLTSAADRGLGGEKDDLESLRRKAETLSRLYELSQILRSVFSLKDIFKKVAEMLFRTTQADRFVVLLKDPSTGDLAPFATEMLSGPASLAGETITISRTILDKVLSDRVSLLSIDAQSDERLGQALSLVMQKVHSVMCAPLLAKDEVLGVIYVDCQQQMKVFTPENLDMLNALAAQTSMAVDNAMTHDQLLKEALARATYGRFMPKHVVEQILADPKALSLGGTNQVVTTLFSDVRGFTTLAEGQPPEVVVQLLNEYFSEMTPIVFDSGGLLDKYIGDGLMALFGVPYEGEDSAFRAVSAAVAMQRRMVALNEELKEKGLPEIAIGIGINTGTVTIGYIGSEQRTDYTVIGDAVNLSARLEKQAEPWQILISRSTLEELGWRFSVKAVGEIKVKGKTVPVQVFEVVWKEPARVVPPTRL